MASSSAPSAVLRNSTSAGSSAVPPATAAAAVASQSIGNSNVFNRSTAALKRLEDAGGDPKHTIKGNGHDDLSHGNNGIPPSSSSSVIRNGIIFVDDDDHHHRNHNNDSSPAAAAFVNPEQRFPGRIAELLHERDNYQELLRDAVGRIFQLEQQLKVEAQHPEVELLQQKALDLYRRSKASIGALNGDIGELRQQYRAEKSAKDAQRLQLVACQKELELARTSLRIQENALDTAQDNVKRLTAESFGLQQSLATTQVALSTMKQERNARMKDDQASVERSLILAQKCDDAEKRTSETMTKLEEAVEFGEKAVRARDHMANRLREYAAEISEMREQETKTYAELTDRSRRDIQQLKQSSEDTITQLRDEVRQLEVKLTDKDIELGRVQRELKTLAMDRERTEHEALASRHDLSTPEDLFRRLAAAEQDRDRLSLLVQSTQALLRQKIDMMSQREEKFEKSMRDQNERLKETVTQCERLSDERVAMAEEIQRLEGQLGLKEKSFQVLNREIQSEIYTMKEKGRLADADRTAREAAMEESQKQSLLDMQQVNKLLRQQVAHWQAEFNNLQNNHELRLRQMKEKLSQAKHRQYELELDLQRHGALNSDLIGRLDGAQSTMIAMSSLE